MENVVKATPGEAAELVELYRKAFRKTGFAALCTDEKREKLLAWLKRRCEEGKIWIMRDENGPVTLGHYEPDKDEVISVVTRDDMEGNGYAERMLKALIVQYPSLKVRPVTRGGKALAKKCGFVPSEDDESLWVRKNG
jgi:hypothetical protein